MVDRLYVRPTVQRHKRCPTIKRDGRSSETQAPVSFQGQLANRLFIAPMAVISETIYITFFRTFFDDEKKREKYVLTWISYFLFTIILEDRTRLHIYNSLALNFHIYPWVIDYFTHWIRHTIICNTTSGWGAIVSTPCSGFLLYWSKRRE